jgi:hypothetical protein
MKLASFALATLIALGATAASAATLSVDLAPDTKNPTSPQMGDNLVFRTVIRNNGSTAVDGLIAWISVVQLDKGKEQPIDLEDWSAHKAVTAGSLAPGQTLATDWPLRLIQAGNYRVVVSAVSRDSTGLVASPFVDFTARQKPVVESQRVLPVALGVPILLAGAMLWRRRRT